MGRNNELILGHIYFEITVETSKKHLEIRSEAQERSLRETNLWVVGAWKVSEVIGAKGKDWDRMCPPGEGQGCCMDRK